jgi:cytochrome b subunit of formate dehydrogenase
MVSGTTQELQNTILANQNRRYTEMTNGTWLAEQLEPKLMYKAGSRYWAAIFVRCVFLLAILGVILGFGLGHLVDGSKITSTEFNASMLSIHFVYLVLCAAMFLLGTYYFFRGRGTETLIPCMNSVWYAAFTVFWYCLVIVAFVINALEMRRTACGVYTTSPRNSDLDAKLCALVDNLP